MHMYTHTQVGVLKKRMAQLEKDEQALRAAAAKGAIAARAAAVQSSKNMMASISREDALGARYNILMQHSQETEQELEGEFPCHIILYNCCILWFGHCLSFFWVHCNILKKRSQETEQELEGEFPCHIIIFYVWGSAFSM